LEYARRIRAEKGIDIEGATEEYLKAVFAESYGQRDLDAFAAARAAYGISYRRNLHPALRALGILNPLAVIVMGGRARSRLPEASGRTAR